MAFSNSDLDVSLYFDLDNDRFRIQDNSNYTGATPAIEEPDIRGVYTLTDPNSNILHQNADYDNPDVATSIDADLYSAYISFTAVDGVYTLVYDVKDVNTGTEYTKTFTFTYASSDIPTVVISVESDVGLATISSTDETAYTATGYTIELDARTHTLTYPASRGETESTSILVDTISLTNLYTGTYVTTITSDIIMTGTGATTTNLILLKQITGTQNHNVWDTDGFYTVRTALDTFYSRWTTAQTDNPKEGRRLAVIWNQINANYGMYYAHKQNGDIENAGEYLNNIKTLLNAEDIDTTVDPSQSVPVTSTIPGYAAQWLNGSGAPAASLGRIVDFYYREDTNGIYSKATGSWVLIGTAGANTIIEFSADGATGWTTTYANGLNYIRFSGDGRVSWTVAAKFIGGYPYYSYADDESGTNAIFSNDTSYTFDSSKEFFAFKFFDEAKGDAELDPSDYTGLYTRYKGEGVAVSVSNIEVPYDVNTTTYDYTNAKAQIILRRAGDDLTTSFTYAKGAESNVTATVGAGTGLVTITNMTSTSGYVDVTASKSGISNITIRVYVSRVDFGEDAIIAYSSVSSVVISTDAVGGAPSYPTGSERPSIYVYVGNSDDTSNWNISIDTSTNINANVVSNNIIDLSNITADSASVVVLCKKSGYDDLYVTIPVVKVKDGSAVVDASSVDDTSLEFKDSWEIVGNSLGISVGLLRPVLCSAMTTTRVALVDLGVSIGAYDFDGTDWSIQGSSLNITGIAAVTALSSTEVAILESNTGTLRTYSFNGSIWSQVNNSYSLTVDTGDSLVALTSTSVLVADTTNNTLQKYDWDGTDWATDGNSLSVTMSYSSLAKLSTTTVALVKSNTTLQKYSFDGTDWTAVGNALTGLTTVSGDAIAGISSDKVAVLDASTDTIFNYKLEGSDWTSVDTNYTLASGSYYSISFYNFPYAVISSIDGSGDSFIQSYMFQNQTIGIKEDGVNNSMMGQGARVAGRLLSGAVTDGAPTPTELSAIIGSELEDDGDHVIVRDTSGAGASTLYYVTKYSGNFHYVQLTRSTP